MYDNILISLDLLPEDDEIVCEKAREVVGLSSGRLSLVHVLQNSMLYDVSDAIPRMANWKDEMKKCATEKLEEIGKKMGIPTDRQHLVVGEARKGILETAQSIDANLIVIGSHGRHGLALMLLGSTAYDVLHGADCDILAVKIKEEE